MASLTDNTLLTANNLGILSGAQNISDNFDGIDRLAFYRFTLTQNSDLSVLFNGTSLRASLIADINGNGIVDSDETVNSIFGSSENFFEPLPSGTYFIQLQTFSTQTNPYNLRIAATPKPGNVSPDPGNSIDQALNLGELSGRREVKDYVGDLDELDFYRFTLNQSSNIGIVISGETRTTPVSIISDENANGVVDNGETVVGRSTLRNSLSETLSAGTYFIQVGRTLSTVTTNYELDITRTINLSGDNRLEGTPGRDTINGLDGNDEILGLGGQDRLIGSSGNDRLLGGRGNDNLIGGGGRDSLFGEAGQDFLKGGGSNDRLDGGAGNDRLDGGKGKDVITTGRGRDHIILRRNQGFDRVTDFQNNQDKIDLNRISFGQLTLQRRRNDVLVKLGRSNVLLIEDTNLRAINRADFV